MKIPAKYCVILDFDGTCIPREQVALIHIVDRNALPPAALQDVKTLWETWGERAIAGRINPLEEKAWMVQTIDLYIRYGMRLVDAYRALDVVRLKRGFRTFLLEMRRRGIPVGICSFGIKQFIWYVLYKEGVHHLVSDIFATDLVTWNANEDAEPIKKLDFDSMVTPSDKGCWSELFARKYGVPNERMLAVGDSLGDKRLGYLKENRLCLVKDISEVETYGLEEHFGYISPSEFFTPVLKWMRLVKHIDKE